MKHHDEAIAAYVTRVRDDPTAVAVIVTGSVGRGTDRPDSDVDLYLIVTEEAWAQAEQSGRIAWVETDGIGYEGGYFDIKLATVGYLREAADRGDDPVRDSLQAASVAWSADPEVIDLIGRVGVRAPDEWRALERSFLAQARLHGHYFLAHGERHGDALLLHHAAVHLATSAARAVLARHHVLFPGPKSLVAALTRAPDAPADLLVLLEQCVTRPGVETAQALLTAIEAHLDSDLTRDESLPLFITDNELAWRTRVSPPEYR